ncbi:MAG: glycosyltransferase [Erysipelotrichaceae bacterium]|nr:glycosyltransferase [Erysipelotrichaceae bacterium]
MKLSILIPAKNQSDKLARHLEEKILPYFDKQGITYDVLICTDGGSEEEQWKLEEHALDFPAHVRLLPLENIKGKGHAVKKAILASDSDYVLFMDADLATDLTVFDLIKPQLGKKDCFIASRDVKGSTYGQKQPFMRRLTHWGCRKVVSMKFHMKGIKDTQCGYKCLRTDIAKKICKLSIIDGFAFDVELLYILYLNHKSIVELPCHWTDDPDSSVGSPLATTKKFYKDLRRIKKNKKNYLFAKGE